MGVLKQFENRPAPILLRDLRTQTGDRPVISGPVPQRVEKGPYLAPGLLADDAAGQLGRRLARQLKVQGVSTELDLVIPRNRAVRSDMNLFEGPNAVPSPKHPPTSEIRQVDFTRRAVGEPEPDPQSLTRLDLQRSNHSSLLLGTSRLIPPGSGASMA